MVETTQEKLRNRLVATESYYSSRAHWLEGYKTEDSCLADTEELLETAGAVVIREAFGTKNGEADIIACYAGRFYAFECKSATGTASDQQWKFIEKVRAAGGTAIVVRCMYDIISVLQEVWK